MSRRLTSLGVCACALAVAACSLRSEEQAVIRQAGDTVAVRRERNPDDIPVNLPVTGTTPVGVRVGHVTIWMDSTRIGQAATALGAKLPLNRYDPFAELVLACFKTASSTPEYVTLETGDSDTSRVVEVVISREPEETMPSPPRCDALPSASSGISNSLGLELGMSRKEVEQLLGPTDTDGYYMGRIDVDDPKVTIDDMQHANVLVYLTYEKNILTSISIHRGKHLPELEDK